MASGIGGAFGSGGDPGWNNLGAPYGGMGGGYGALSSGSGFGFGGTTTSPWNAMDSGGSSNATSTGPFGGWMDPYGTGSTTSTGFTNSAASPSGAGVEKNLGSGTFTTPTQDPQLTQNLLSYLNTQVGQGVQAYPGQLSAAPNDLINQLMSFLQGGNSSIPGASQLEGLATTGDPINQTPAWQAMVAAMQQNTAQNANLLKEQYAAGGSLASSPYGDAMADYYNQADLNQNALLGQMTTTAQQQAVQNMLSADTSLQGEAQSMGEYSQGLSQSALNALYQEFIRTQPQYNPLNSEELSGALASPDTFQKQSGGGIIGALGSLFGSVLGGGGLGGLLTSIENL